MGEKWGKTYPVAPRMRILVLSALIVAQEEVVVVRDKEDEGMRVS